MSHQFVSTCGFREMQTTRRGRGRRALSMNGPIARTQYVRYYLDATNPTGDGVLRDSPPEAAEVDCLLGRRRERRGVRQSRRVVRLGAA